MNKMNDQCNYLEQADVLCNEKYRNMIGASSYDFKGIIIVLVSSIMVTDVLAMN